MQGAHFMCVTQAGARETSNGLCSLSLVLSQSLVI